MDTGGGRCDWFWVAFGGWIRVFRVLKLWVACERIGAALDWACVLESVRIFDPCGAGRVLIDLVH